MDNERIRIATSIPSLKNKIKVDLDGSTEAIYWHIKFNVPLDEMSVSDKTMDVTDTEGYIMRTDIMYNKLNHMIVISPLDTYEQNRYYLLNISKKVKSARGQNLRSTIHILFKLLNNQISEYKVLKQNVKVPKPKVRPPDYDARQARGRPQTELDRIYINKAPQDRLSPVNFKVKVAVAVLGLFLVLISALSRNMWFLVISMLVCVAGAVHIVIQLSNKNLRSALLFNKGVRRFNKTRYREAEVYFKRALALNPDNELAEYGVYKTGLYIE